MPDPIVLGRSLEIDVRATEFLAPIASADRIGGSISRRRAIGF